MSGGDYGALCVGLSTFGGVPGGSASGDGEPGEPAGEEPDVDAEPLRGELAFAGERTRELASVLEDFGYRTETHGSDSLPTAELLGAAVRAVTQPRGPGAVQIVHVLSHGLRATDRDLLYVVGSDNRYNGATQVDSWLQDVRNSRNAPHTLFLVDTCDAGTAARPEWLYEGRTARKAWIVAGTEPDANAYGGRFTRAVTTVLRRIHAGEVDIFPGEFVPFQDIVRWINTELERQGGEPQRVLSTLIDAGTPPLELPFFRNPRQPTAQSMPEARQAADPAAIPFLDLDATLDPAHCLDQHYSDQHWLERAAGHPDFGKAPGAFTGRTDQLRQLSEWIARGDGAPGDGAPGNGARRDGDGLCVVTGGAGSGKSALLGIVVCTTLPRLREPTLRLWEHLGDVVPPEIPLAAAVHLRERSADDMADALVRQLSLPEGTSGADAVVREVSRLPEPPLIVVDALDEAVDQGRLIEELLLPLARAGRDRRPACRLLVGMRPWQEFAELSGAAGRVIDLDEVAPERLRADLTEYVKDLLQIAPGYGERSRKALRGVLADGIAAAIARPGASRGGEFLSTALFVNWLRTAYPAGMSEAEAAGIAGRVPATVPEIMELDLGIAPGSSWTGSSWLRPVLTAIAHAYGDGMPASVIRRLAPLFAVDLGQAGDLEQTARAELTAREFDEALGRIRFYLRSSRDSDGVSLYRLFHQGLVDHLRDEPADLHELVDRLLRDVPPAQRNDRRGWSGAEPYVARHAARHGLDAGRMELITGLSRGERETLFNTTRTRYGRLVAEVFRETDKEDPSPAERHGLLAVNAARYGVAELAAGLARSPGQPAPGQSAPGLAAPGLAAPGWWPSFATGGEISSVPEAVFAAHADSVWAVAYAELDGRPVAVTGSDDGALRVWDLTSRQLRGEPMRGHAGWVRGVATAVLDDRAVAISTGWDGMLRMWDLATRRPVNDPLRAGRKLVTALTVVSLRGLPVALTCGADHTVQLWDLASWRHLRTFTGHAAAVRAVACTVLDGEQVAVSVDDDAALLAWGLDDLTERLRIDGARNAVTCTTVGGEPVAVTAADSDAGPLRVWDLRSGRLRHQLEGHKDQVRALDWAELDGRPVAISGGDDRTIRVWDLESGQQLRTIRGHTDAIRAVACSPARPEVLISAGDDRTARLWELPEKLGPAQSSLLDGYEEREFEHSLDGTIQALAGTAPGGEPAVVLAGSRAMALWDLARGTPRDLPVPDGCHPSSIACRTFAGTGGGTGGSTGGGTTGSMGGGRTLAVVGGTDGDVRELDLASGKTTELAPRMHSQRVAAAAVGFSGRLPVAATAGAEGAEGQVCLWDLATKQRIISRRLTSRVKSLALTTVTGAATLVATSDNGDIHILDMMLRVTAQLRIGIQSTAAYAVDCLQHDDTTIAVTGHSNAAYVWDLTDHELIGTLPVEGEVKAVACAKLPGRPIAVLMTGTSLSVWDLRHHGLLTTLRTRFIPPAGLAVFSGRDDRALTVVTLAENKLREHKFTLADPAAGQPREALAYEALAHETPRPASRLGEVVAGHASPVTAVSAGRAGSRHVMVTTDKGGHVIIWDLNTGSVLERLPHSFVFSMTGTIPPISAVSAVRGELAVVLGRGQRTRIWRSSARHQAIEGSVTALCCIDLRGRPTVVIGGKYRVARIVDVENWQEVGQINHRFKRVFDLDSRDDGHGSVTVFVAGQLGDGSAVRSFSLPPGRHEDELELPSESITRIRVTEIGHVPHLVTLNASGSIQVWDLSARQVVGGRLGGHTAKFNAMAVGSVEGLPVVVTGARDRHVRMWSLATREEIQDIRMPGPVQAVEMGRRGDIIAAFGTEIACLRRVRT